MSTERLEQLIAQAWTAVSGHGDTAAAPADLIVSGRRGDLASNYAVADTAAACIGSALLAAAALQRVRGGRWSTVSLDRGHVAAAVRSEAYFTRGGVAAGMGFGRLSRFWQT